MGAGCLISTACSFSDLQIAEQPHHHKDYICDANMPALNTAMEPQAMSHTQSLRLFTMSMHVSAQQLLPFFHMLQPTSATQHACESSTALRHHCVAGAGPHMGSAYPTIAADAAARYQARLADHGFDAHAASCTGSSFMSACLWSTGLQAASPCLQALQTTTSMHIP